MFGGEIGLTAQEQHPGATRANLQSSETPRPMEIYCFHPCVGMTEFRYIRDGNEDVFPVMRI